MTRLKDIREDIKEVEEVASEVRHDSSLSKGEKKELLEQLRRTRRKLKTKERREVAIFYEDVHYGQVPSKLLWDSNIPLQAKGLYAVLHSFGQPKELMATPKTFVTLKTLAKVTGMHKNSVREYIKVLAEAGWIKVKSRGYRRSNWYFLCAKKRRIRKD